MTKPIKQFKPMKASDVKDPDTLKYPLYGFIKFDGVYAFVKDNQLLGRSLKPLGNKFITRELSESEFEGFAGELCFGTELNVQDLCRNTTSCTSSFDKTWEYTWVLFDYNAPHVIDLPFIERYEALLVKQKEMQRMFDCYNIKVAELTVINNAEELMTFYNDCVMQGYEGSIYRQPDGKWKNGKATLSEQYFLRMKPQGDTEAVIYGCEEAQTNLNEAETNELGRTFRSSHQANKVGNGMVGSLLCVDVVTGNKIKIGAGKLDHTQRKELFDNLPIGSVVKYRSMTSGVKDAPRFARFYSFRAVEDMDVDLQSTVNQIINDVKAGLYK